MKTICITSFHGIISRNILQSDVIPELQKQPVRIVLLVPESKAAYFQESYGDLVDEIVGVSTTKRRAADFLRLVSIGSISLENLYIRRLVAQKRRGKVLIARLAHYTIGQSLLLKRVLRQLDYWLTKTDDARSALERVKPDLVFATDVYMRDDINTLRMAEQLGIETMGMVRSWDNVTTKGVLMVWPQRLIVHNQILRDELHEHNGFPKDRVVVTGIPHYDSYGQARLTSRADFCAELGLDPAKQIILFAPGGQILYHDDHLLLNDMVAWLDQATLRDRVQFLVRLPPSDTIDQSTVSDDPNVVFDTPGIAVGKGRKNNELSNADEEHLKDTLWHSDVLLTLVSTIVIDAAAFDLPTIILSYNPAGARDDVDKFSRYSHFKKLLDTNTCTKADTHSECITDLERYLADKTADTDKRRAIVDQYCHGANRTASTQVATAIQAAITHD